MESPTEDDLKQQHYNKIMYKTFDGVIKWLYK